jgi:hypothetical protein
VLSVELFFAPLARHLTEGSGASTQLAGLG